MSTRHIQNEDIKNLADVGSDYTRLPSSTKIGTLQFGGSRTLADILQDRLVHGQPLQMHQSYPADTLLRIEPSEIVTLEGKRSATPIKSQIPTIPLSTINFQTGVTSGATFDIVFPNGVVGERVVLGLTLLTNGTIKGIFSAAYTLTRPNPGVLFVKGGLPLGFLELEWTNATPGRFKTVGALGNTVENSGIYLFGSGAGGGAGEGDANTFEIEVKSRLRDSTFGWAATNIASQDETTLIDDPNSTAEFDIANSLFLFPNIGAVLRSLQMYGSSFLGTNSQDLQSGFRDHTKVEFHASWVVDDSGATYEVSRDGGLNWLALTLNRVGGSKYYIGEGLFPEPVNTQALVEYPTANTPVVLEMNATVLKRAVKVVVTAKSKFQKFNFRYVKTGSPLGNLYFSWVKDSAGAPSTNLADILATSAPVSVTGLASGSQNVDISVPAILPPGTYWMVIEGDAAYRASYVASTTEVDIRADSAGTYSGGVSYEFNGTVWAPTANRQIIFSSSGFEYELLARITGSVDDSTLEGFAIFFGEQSGALLDTITEEPQYFEFSGTEDKTEFVMTNFLPHPAKTKVTFVNAGLTFIRPFFDVDGYKIIFKSGTFLYPSISKLIVKVEHEGSAGSVNNDLAKFMNLLSANGLGSVDPSVDMSSPGVGIKLKRPDGTLRELVINNNDDLEVRSVP